MGREKVGYNSDETEERGRGKSSSGIRRRVVEKFNDSLNDEDRHQAQTSSSGERSVLGNVLDAFIDIVGEVTGEQSSRNQSSSREGNGISSVAGRAADQLRRRNR